MISGPRQKSAWKIACNWERVKQTITTIMWGGGLGWSAVRWGGVGWCDRGPISGVCGRFVTFEKVGCWN